MNTNRLWTVSCVPCELCTLVIVEVLFMYTVKSKFEWVFFYILHKLLSTTVYCIGEINRSEFTKNCTLWFSQTLALANLFAIGFYFVVSHDLVPRKKDYLYLMYNVKLLEHVNLNFFTALKKTNEPPRARAQYNNITVACALGARRKCNFVHKNTLYGNRDPVL